MAIETRAPSDYICKIPTWPKLNIIHTNENYKTEFSLHKKHFQAGSMEFTSEETERRRKIQKEYNRKNGIVPKTIISAVKDTMQQHLSNSGYRPDDYGENLLEAAEDIPSYYSIKELEKEIKKLEKQMHSLAKELAFEKAAELRDRIKKLRLLEIEIG